MNNYKQKLQKKMLLSRKHYLSILEQDERLAPLLKNISDAYIGKDYSNFTTSSKRGRINLADLEILSKRLFLLGFYINFNKKKGYRFYKYFLKNLIILNFFI